MPTVTHLTTGSTTTGATSYDTASVTFTPGRLPIIGVVVTGTLPIPPLTVTGAGMTWQEIPWENPLQFSARTMHAFRAVSGTPTPGPLTISAGGAALTSGLWTVVEVADVNTAAPFAQVRTERPIGANPLALSFNDPVTGDLPTLAFIALTQDIDASPGAGWTALGQAAQTAPITRWLTEFADPGQQDITANSADATARAGYVIGLELTPAAAPQTVAVGQATSAEAAQQLVVILGKRTQFALPIAVAKTAPSRNMNRATEADTAQPIAARKARAAGEPTEAETALPIAARKARTLGQATNPTTAQPVARRKAKALGQPVTANTAATLARRKARTLGQVTEVDTARVIQVGGRKIIALGIATETDTPQTFTRSKRRTLGQPATTETATVLGRRKRIQVTAADESDTALTARRVQSRPLDVPATTDTATPVGIGKTLTIGQAAETAAASTFAAAKVVTIGIADEANTARAVTSTTIIPADITIISVTLEPRPWTAELDPPARFASLDPPSWLATREPRRRTASLDQRRWKALT